MIKFCWSLTYFHGEMYTHVPSKQQQIYSSFREQGTHYQTFLKNETIGLITPSLSPSFSLSHTHTHTKLHIRTTPSLSPSHTHTYTKLHIPLPSGFPMSKFSKLHLFLGAAVSLLLSPTVLSPSKHFSFCPVATALDVVTVTVRPPEELVVGLSLWSCFL